MTGVILAGGKNSRMGRKKAFIEINGTRIIDTTIAVLKEIFKEVIIITNTPEDFEYTKLKLVKDLIPEKGSLGGLYTGINEARYDQCFVTACDMPYINGSLINYISDIKGYDVVVPKIKGRFEPLFASYSKECMEVIRKQLDENNLRITDIFSSLRLREVNETEIMKYDSKLLSLININTPDELRKLLYKKWTKY